MTGPFDDLVDTTGLTDAERARLRGVHDMLVEAGPPPELGPSLAEAPAPPDERGAEIVPLAARRRRRTAGALIAAVVALVCFAAGYAVADRVNSDVIQVVRVVQMQGVASQGLARSAQASVNLGEAQPGGNWPIELTVTGLPKQTGRRAYYELFVWRHGKPSFPCGGFKMQEGTTSVRFTVPYELKDTTRLVVTAIEPGESKWPGTVVMRTA